MLRESLTVGLLVVSLVAMAPPAAAEPPPQCEAYVPGTCAFSCDADDLITLYVYTDVIGAPVAGSATCGTVELSCSGKTSCTASGRTSTAGLGACTATIGWKARCTAAP